MLSFLPSFCASGTITGCKETYSFPSNFIEDEKFYFIRIFLLEDYHHQKFFYWQSANRTFRRDESLVKKYTQNNHLVVGRLPFVRPVETKAWKKTHSKKSFCCGRIAARTSRRDESLVKKYTQKNNLVP